MTKLITKGLIVMYKIILFLAVTFTLACGNQIDPKATTFGESITKKGSISYDELLTKLDESDSLNTKVVGTVNEVCQAKGCWMTIVSENSDKVMRVKFKDYAFFVPKDISGRKVVFEGKAYRELTSVDELRHYAEDAGQSEEEIAAITDAKESYKFMASGVLLLD
jgi:hypothetical protein